MPRSPLCTEMDCPLGFNNPQTPMNGDGLLSWVQCPRYPYEWRWTVLLGQRPRDSYEWRWTILLDQCPPETPMNEDKLFS
jgi:hypothetical protein